MKVEKLEIRIPAQYEEGAGAYQGLVHLKGPAGAMQVALTPTSIAAIFKIIQTQVAATARSNASQVAEAVLGASDSTLLLTSSIEVE